MDFSTPGIGSGLDIKGIVASMVKADLMPAQDRHDKKLNSVNTQLSAMGQLKSAISSFQTILDTLSFDSKFYKMQYSLSEAGYVYASLTDQAAAGLYQIQVQQLAQAQSLSSAYYANSTTTVGSGSITINFGTYSNNNTIFTQNSDVPSLTINIDSTNDSLVGICDAINAADGGVTASIVQDSLGARLVLTSSQTGDNYAMQITGTLSALNYDPTTNNTPLTQNLAAQNGLVLINGLQVNSSSNQVENAITGLTLNLQQADPGYTVTLTVENDVKHVRDSINDFVKKYNDFMALLTNLSGFNLETKQKGVLQGDNLIRELKCNLYQLATNPITAIGPGPIQCLADIGITTDKHGLLVVDPDMLDEALSDNYQYIGNLFAKTVTATDPNIKIASYDTAVASGTYDVLLSEFTPGVSMSGTIGGIKATSTDGITLTGTGDLSTLSIEVLAGISGYRGQIIVSDGLAALINDFLSSYVDEDGELEERLDHLEHKAKELNEMQHKIDERGESLEKMYLKKWNALDLLITQMQSASSALTQLMANLPKFKTK